MPEVIDNFVHEKVAQEIYDSVTNSFSLSSYKSTCCYDSKLDRNSAFDYEAEAEFLFAQYFNIDKSKHHFYINSFLSASHVLGPHKPNDSHTIQRSRDGEHASSIKIDDNWGRHFLFLICPNGQTIGGDFYFRGLEAELEQTYNSHFNKVDFCHNRLVISDPKKERLMSYVEAAEYPMVHLNLLTTDE